MVDGLVFWREVLTLLIMVLHKTTLHVGMFFPLKWDISPFHLFPSSLGSQNFLVGHHRQQRDHYVIPDNYKQILPTAPQ